MRIVNKRQLTHNSICNTVIHYNTYIKRVNSFAIRCGTLVPTPDLIREGRDKLIYVQRYENKAFNTLSMILNDLVAFSIV